MNSGDRLDSWKAIAEYLGRDRTTVMRWERTAGLPVRRVQGGVGRSVFAFKEELDRWLAGGGVASFERSTTAESARSRSPLRWSLAAVAGIVLASAVGARWSHGSSPIASAALVGEEIVARDPGGREIWRHALPHIDGNTVAPRLLVSDINGDGQRELLAAVHFMKQRGDAYGAVMAFSANGELRWQRSLDDRYTFGGEAYGEAWFPEDILVYRSGGATRIAVAQHHHTWWPSVVVTYDQDGKAVDRFVNAGWLRSLNMTADGRYLLAAGISNAFGGAALVILDSAKPGGTSPGDGGSLPACSNCPQGSPVAYLVAPWSELARPSDTPNAIVQVNNDGGIQWRAMQRGVQNGKSPEVIISLSPTLDLVRQDVNNYFTELLNGSPEHRLPLREWTPATGWRQIAQ